MIYVGILVTIVLALWGGLLTLGVLCECPELTLRVLDRGGRLFPRARPMWVRLVAAYAELALSYTCAKAAREAAERGWDEQTCRKAAHRAFLNRLQRAADQLESEA